MAEIRPFRALRYTAKAGDIASLVCPPYDIIGGGEHRALLAQSRYNAVRLELPERSAAAAGDAYAQAGATLRAWLSGGVLRQDTDPGFYLYEEEFDAFGERKKVKGFLCAVRLEEFSKGIILPHEETLSKAKEDRFRLMQATGCNFSPVYSLYGDEGGATAARLDALSSGKPRYGFTLGGVTHRLWLVNDREVLRAIQEDFRDRRLYIADGHHRYETALNYRGWKREQGTACEGDDFVMMLLVSMENDGLTVFPTHRLVRGLKDFSARELLRRCAEQFDVMPREDVGTARAELAERARAGERAFAFYSGGAGWTLLTLRDKAAVDAALPGRSAAYRSLDVSVLHSLILEKILGIDRANMAAQKNLVYTRSAEEAVASVRQGKSQCAFLLNPTRVDQIRDVAAAGEKMPQKSTYFYPKPLTGLVFHRLDGGVSARAVPVSARRRVAAPTARRSERSESKDLSGGTV